MDESSREKTFQGKYLDLLLNIIVGAAAVFAISYLNYSMVRYLFGGEFNQNLASIEISYIQMAKFWAEGGSLWRPQWYFGHPWHVFYTPFLPFLELLAHNIFSLSFGQAYRVITALGYVGAPVALFFFVWQLSKSKSGAFVSALFYSVVPSIFYFLQSTVAGDTLTNAPEPRRLAILVRWGEGPHTLSILFLPLFGLFLFRYFETKKLREFLLTCVFLALGALTNAIFIWAAFMLTFAFVVSSLMKKNTEFIPFLKSLLMVFSITFGLVAFWFNLPFLSTFFKEGGGALNNWLAIFPWGVLALVLAGVAICLLIKKLFSGANGLPFAIVLFLMFFAIVYVYYSSGSERLEFAPQALRLNTEVDLALSILAGVVVSGFFAFYQKIEKTFLKIGVRIGGILIFGVITGGLLYWGNNLIKNVPEYTKSLEQSKIGRVENTAEYRSAKKLESQVGDTNQRVVAPGNYGFWLNYFSNVPQLRGALFQSSTHFWPDHIYYQLTNGNDGEISLDWLKIGNIGKIIYTGAGSAETYRDYKVPRSKFDSVLTEIEEDAGDIYYSVPLANDSLAKVVDFDEILSVKKPYNAIDEDPINAYVSAIEKKASRRIAYTKVTDSEFKIAGEVGDGEAILVQNTYDSGWKVKASRGEVKGWKKVKDNFDFMVFVPKNPGKFEADIVYAKPMSVYFGYLVTLATISLLIYKGLRFRAVGIKHNIVNDTPRVAAHVPDSSIDRP